MGGTVHETYPAAGYILNDTLAIGLLTDAGNRNLWTRNIRRRPSKQGEIGFRAIREICDANLIRISNKDERLRQNNFVKYTFGEVSDFNHPVDTCLYPIPNVTTWKTYHNGYVKKHGNIYKIEKRGKEVSGVRIPYYLTDGFYTIRFKHRSNNPITIRLFKGEGIENKDIIGLHYQSDIPSLQSEWVEQEETVFIANTEDKPIYLLIAASGLNDSSSSLLIKDLEVIRSDAHNYAYHRLEQGKKSVKKVFIFVNPSQATLHDLRLASQIYLAEGLNFVGTTEEKCVYACYQMLMWITSRYNFAPLNVPSINYAPDMYNRDSFWSLMGVYDKEASEEIFNAWASTQDERGAIGTIITPSMGSREVKGNEATLEFLWYAWVNHKLYGTPIPMDKIKKAFEFCMNEYDPDGDGICAAEFVLGQNDVVDYPDKTTDLAVNQGMFAVTMQVAKELGMPVTQDYIEKTNQEYRNFYDNKRGYLVDNRKYPYSITFNSLLPEFVSWWLFNRPILTSEMVINTLNRIPYRNGYSPIISHVGDIYFTQENKPFSPNMFWDNGVYYNAGSWLREEICGYVAGLKHGWKDAEMRIKKRLAVDSPNMFWDNGVYYNAGSWLREEICGYVAGLKHGWKDAEMRIKKRLAVEINLHPDEPFSHEFLPFDVTIPGCWWPSTRVFSWNVFVLRALEVAAVEINLHPDEPFSHEFLPFDVTIPGCWWPSTRVFSWNVFVLRALEVAGMRLPVQDPGYAKSVLSAGR